MINWIKQNKLPALIIAILFVFLLKNNGSPIPLMKSSSPSYQSESFSVSAPRSISNSAMKSLPPESSGGNYVHTTTTNRLVVQESNLSMVVKDVRDVSNKIVDYTKQNSGFMVNESFSSPEEAPFETVTVRVPYGKLPQILDYFRKLAIKVA